MSLARRGIEIQRQLEIEARHLNMTKSAALLLKLVNFIKFSSITGLIDSILVWLFIPSYTSCSMMTSCYPSMRILPLLWFLSRSHSMKRLHSSPVEGSPYSRPPDFWVRIVSVDATASGFLGMTPVDCCVCVCWRSRQTSRLSTCQWSFRSWRRNWSWESRCPARPEGLITAEELETHWGLAGSGMLSASGYPGVLLICSLAFVYWAKCYSQSVHFLCFCRLCLAEAAFHLLQWCSPCLLLDSQSQHASCCSWSFDFDARLQCWRAGSRAAGACSSCFSTRYCFDYETNPLILPGQCQSLRRRKNRRDSVHVAVRTLRQLEW